MGHDIAIDQILSTRAGNPTGAVFDADGALMMVETLAGFARLNGKEYRPEDPPDFFQMRLTPRAARGE